MAPLGRKNSSESIGRRSPARRASKVKDDAESITSWGPDGSHELEFDELSTHSGPGSEYALSRPNSEAVLDVRAPSVIDLQPQNKHALRSGELGEQKTSSLLRGMDVEEGRPVAGQLRDALSAHAVALAPICTVGLRAIIIHKLVYIRSNHADSDTTTTYATPL